MYQNVFGVPGKGVHSYRIFNIAIVDVVFTVLAAVLISYIWNISVMYTIPILFLAGILFHRIFCVRTTIDKVLFS